MNILGCGRPGAGGFARIGFAATHRQFRFTCTAGLVFIQHTCNVRDGQGSWRTQLSAAICNAMMHGRMFVQLLDVFCTEHDAVRRSPDNLLSGLLVAKQMPLNLRKLWRPSGVELSGNRFVSGWGYREGLRRLRQKAGQQKEKTHGAHGPVVPTWAAGQMIEQRQQSLKQNTTPCHLAELFSAALNWIHREDEMLTHVGMCGVNLLAAWKAKNEQNCLRWMIDVRHGCQTCL